jgi:hypothetical protein
MSEREPKPPDVGPSADSSPRRSFGWMATVRYGLPAAMIIGGVVLALVGSGDQAFEGLVMGIGGGLSVLLLNGLYRVGVQGESERADEDDARAYYGEHGVWPEDDDRLQ